MPVCNLGGHLLAKDDDGGDDYDDALQVVADGVRDRRHGIKGEEGTLVVKLCKGGSVVSSQRL